MEMSRQLCIQSMDAPSTFPHTCPVHLFHALVLELYPLTINQKMFMLLTWKMLEMCGSCLQPGVTALISALLLWGPPPCPTLGGLLGNQASIESQSSTALCEPRRLSQPVTPTWGIWARTPGRLIKTFPADRVSPTKRTACLHWGQW